MAAATSIMPFQPPVGVPARDALAHAHNFIDKMTKRHETLQKVNESLESAKERLRAGVKVHGNTLIQMSCTATTAAALGVINGRFGNDAGVCEKWGVNLDAGVALAGHLAGFIVSYVDDREEPDVRLSVLAEVMHTVGDAGLASSVYRFCHQHGSEAKARALAGRGEQPAPAAVNGAKGGTVYTVHPK